MAISGTILIAGASPSGASIGSHLALLYAAQGLHVITLSRSRVDSSAAIEHIACDIASEADVSALASNLTSRQLRLAGIINAVGLLHADGIRPEKALSQLKLAQMQAVFAANAFAPILLVQALVPLLRKDAPCFIASLSARVGSIADNRLGGWYSYRAAKAAQNQLFKTLAIELQRTHPLACCLQLHPGTVDTVLSKPFQSGVSPDKLFTAQFSAESLVAVIASKQAVDTGTFWDWNGQSVPW